MTQKLRVTLDLDVVGKITDYHSAMEKWVTHMMKQRWVMIDDKPVPPSVAEIIDVEFFDVEFFDPDMENDTGDPK